MRIIGREVEPKLRWLALTEALEAGHQLPRAEVADTVLRRGPDTLLTRSAWIDGLGLAVKAASVFPAAQPSINGAVNLLSDTDGTLEAIVDFHLVTKWKTAGDSLLSARRLARPDAGRVLVIGAGHVAESMIEAYRALIPDARISVWSRSGGSAAELAGRTGTQAVNDLEPAVRDAEIIATATMATQPVLRGEWLSPGTHVDLIGAYRPDMREADDDVLTRSRLFADSRATTIAHIGEFADPVARGVIAPEAVLADFYDIAAGRFARRSAEEITVCKNGGGAHLDLMTARWILEAA